jgi:hypothetical protein
MNTNLKNKKDRQMTCKMTTWWIVWDDLKWPDDDIYDKIRIRADMMQKANVDIATIFGAHFRWDFMPIWDCLHDYMRTVADELHERDIKLFDHHSALLIHRHNGRKEMRNVKINSGPHLPFSPSYQAAESWTFQGKHLNDWRMIDVRTGKPVYLERYAAEQFCHNNDSFIEAYLEYVKLLIEETTIDGLMCDDAIYFSGFNACVCNICQNKFKAAYGNNIPDHKDFSFWGNWKNKAWRDWLEFRFSRNGNFLEKVKSILPENYPLMSCCSGSSGGWNNHSAQDVRQFNRACNMVHLELCGNTPAVNDPQTINKSIAYKIAQTSHHLAAAKNNNYICVGMGFGFSEASANIIWALNKMLGSSCWFSTLKARLGLPNSEISHLPDDPEAISKAFSFESKHNELFDTELLSQVGVYFSYNTRNNSFFGDIKNGYEQDYTDTVSELFSAGISVDTLLELPKEPSVYSLVILPSALCLSEEEIRMIKSYITNGGQVIATGPLGLYDGNGEQPLESFASKYNVDIRFEEPERKDDFWEGEWQTSITPDACSNIAKWHTFTHNFYWHPMRLQDHEISLNLVEKTKDLMHEEKIEILNSDGYLSSLHRSRNDKDLLILQMIAKEYDVKIDEELDRKRKHRSRINLITEVVAKNVSQEIILKINSTLKEIKVFTPFNSEKARVSQNDSNLKVTLPLNCSYVIYKIRTQSSTI